MIRTTFALLTLFAACCGKEVDLLRVHCDPEFESLHEFFLSLDEKNNITSIVRRSLQSAAIFSNYELQTKEVVVAAKSDKKVILLSCPNYNPSAGGPFIIRYMYNGISNSYKVLALWLEKEGDGWQLYTPPPNKTKVKSLKIIPRKLAGMTIGIQYLQIIP